MSRLTFLGLAGLFLLSTGCQSIKAPRDAGLPWAEPKEKTYQTPERIIAVWSDTIYQQPGKPPTRGFGGRLYFYDKQGQAVPVNGQLTIYTYDDTGYDLTADRPTRKYVFTKEQLTRYYGESELGASYNVWVPWDNVGGEEKHINLFPVFTDESGKVVRGVFTESRLPGRRVISEEERRGFYVSRRRRGNSAADQPAAQTQNGPSTTANAPQEATPTSLRTTTIRVPRTMADRFGQASATPSIPKPQMPATANIAPMAQGNLLPPGAVPAYNYGQPTQAVGNQGVQPATYVAPNSPILGQSGYSGVKPQDTVSANSHAWARQDQRSVRFEQPKFRAPTLPGVRPSFEHGLSQPSLVTRPSGLPSGSQ